MGIEVHCLVDLFEMEFVPNALWTYRCVLRGLRSSDPEVREMALSVASTAEGPVWTRILLAHRDTEPHLVRYVRYLLDERRAERHTRNQ